MSDVPAHILRSSGPFLSLEDCAVVAQKVRDLQSQWLPYPYDSDEPSFYRLGASTYLDIYVNLYMKVLRHTNPVLKESFGDLYQRLCQQIESRLQSPVELADNIAYPGFHIYHHNKMPKGGKIHWDMQQHQFVMNGFGVDADTSQLYSVTLPVELTEGSGINFWDKKISESTLAEPATSKGRPVTEQKPDYTVAYEVGHLYIFNSLCLHQIRPNDRPANSKRRMTLQGHLLKKTTGEFLLFW